MEITIKNLTIEVSDDISQDMIDANKKPEDLLNEMVVEVQNNLGLYLCFDNEQVVIDE